MKKAISAAAALATAGVLSLGTVGPAAAAAPASAQPAGAVTSTDSALLTCLTGTMTTIDAFGSSEGISGYFGEGAVSVRITNTSPVPVVVYISENSGLGNPAPNISPGSAVVMPGQGYTFGYWGGLDYGGTRRYDFSVQAVTPGFNVLIGYAVYANRC